MPMSPRLSWASSMSSSRAINKSGIKPLLADILDAGCEGKHPRWSGRCHPRAMNEQTIKHADAMLKDTENYPFIGDVIDQLKIGRTAFYRYFPTDRIKQLRNEHETNLQTG